MDLTVCECVDLLSICTGAIAEFNNILNKKLFLREHKRHTAHRVDGICYVVPM